MSPQVNLPHYAAKLETTMHDDDPLGMDAPFSPIRNRPRTDLFRRQRRPWVRILVIAAVAIALAYVCVGCVPPARGGYGNSNGQPPATMTTVGGYSGQAGS